MWFDSGKGAKATRVIPCAYSLTVKCLPAGQYWWVHTTTVGWQGSTHGKDIKDALHKGNLGSNLPPRWDKKVQHHHHYPSHVRIISGAKFVIAICRWLGHHIMTKHDKNPWFFEGLTIEIHTCSLTVFSSL